MGKYSFGECMCSAAVCLTILVKLVLLMDYECQS